MVLVKITSTNPRLKWTRKSPACLTTSWDLPRFIFNFYEESTAHAGQKTGYIRCMRKNRKSEIKYRTAKTQLRKTFKGELQ